MKILWAMLLIFSGLMETLSERFKVVGPAAPLVAVAGEDLILPCSLQPNISAEGMMVEWFRLHETDTLVHLYINSADRNGEQMESYRGRTALFKEELKKGNASLKLSALQPSDDGAYTCLIRDVDSYIDDVTLYVEVKGKGFHGWKIAIICIFVFAILLAAFTAYILKDKYSKKQLSPTQCSVITYMRVHSKNPKKELDLRKFSTSEEGHRRLIPAVSNCRKAQFTGCNLTEQSIETLSAALKTENSLLKELDLCNNNLQDSGVEKLSDGLKSSHCKVEKLRFAGCNLTAGCSETLSATIKTENSSLKELDLSNNNLQDSGVEKLSDGLKSSYCKVEKLRFAGCNLTAGCTETLSATIKTENSSLKELDLSNNNLQDSGVEKLSDGLKSSYCKVEKLRLVVCNLGGKTSETLGTALLSETWTLKELDLSKNNLRDSGMEKLSDGLKSSNCVLEILRLATCNFTGKSCTFLISALKSKISSLKELDLSSNDLQGSGVEELFMDPQSSPCKLQILRLALCNIEERVCEYLGSVLNQENSLIELDLSNNDLQDSGVKLLSAGLKSSHCKLEILRLSGCMITEEGCSFLASSLSSSSSHLTELDLTYNNPEESGENLLTPHCKPGTLRVEHGGNIRMKTGLKKYGCDLTLDPNTASRSLSLSEENRRVEFGGGLQPYPDHPERFDWWAQVLSRERVTGRCYWEAECSGERGAAVALSYKTISRKGGSDSRFGGNEKSWSLRIFKNSYSVHHNNNRTDLPPPPSPSNRVGVYVDCPAGTLSFYTISSHTHTPSSHTPSSHTPSHTHTFTHLHTFYTTFTEPLYAGFYVYSGSSVRLCDIE
ncbi:NACHT, LRR and PYD domains-containing protein 3-like isoform X5 [Astyanax mexicanus]|uniref:NACHT, LRR and PYD domains-containing protein 3-like isoform X5 n=1 Tax=Astyanax mexicanus TaxID=7994 RepID=UPI0020CB0C55|nr:NACHT, LRR and PYD domains-containing protein 3-like isoform X5 [Astyanax mexicanus]